MDETEKYLFEVHGYLVIRGALSQQEVAAANAAIDHHADQIGIRANDLAHESEMLKGTQGRGDLGGMLTWEKPHCDPFRQMIAHDKFAPYLEEVLGPGFRLEGLSIITMDEYEEMGRTAAIQQIQEVLKGGPVYISLDIDGLDPAYLPGTGVPEIGGLIPRDVQVILRSLQGMDIVGADISEVSPCYDPTGITCVTVANLMFEMLCIIADSISAKR